jgi:hypothetical protein
MVLHRIFRFLKLYMRRAILVLFLLAIITMILLHIFKYPILLNLKAFFTRASTIILGSSIAIIGLVIAILQTRRKDTLGEYLFEHTFKNSLKSLTRLYKLSDFKEVKIKSKILNLEKIFPDIEVLVENAIPPFGFNYEDIFCSFNPRLFGIENEYEINSQSILSNQIPKVSGLPKGIRNAFANLLKAKFYYLQENFIDFRFFNGPVARVENYTVFKDNLTERIKLVIDFRLTNYYTFVCTNETLEEFNNSEFPLTPTGLKSEIKDNAIQDLTKYRGEIFKILNKYIKNDLPHFSPKSLLANNLVVNLNIITSDNMLLYVKRSGNVARKPSFFSCAVSGDVDPSRKFQSSFLGGDIDDDGSPNPFLTAIRETWEELNLKITRDQITFLAFCRVIKLNQPFLIGEVQMTLSYKEITLEAKLARDLYERDQLLFYNLDENPESILQKLKTEFDFWGQPSAFGLILSLIRRHGYQKIMSITKTLW